MPINKPSPFSATWNNPSRPAVNFAHVYEADGTTLAANQHMVENGQIAEFTFDFRVPAGTKPGTYRQAFQPILEGSTMWNMGGVAWWDVNVQDITFKATYAGQSGYPTFMQGESGAAFLRYKNTGNQPWFDDTTAPAWKTYAVHLATTMPINKPSPFSATWNNPSRPAVNFAHVYEADGTTLAANQHIAQPGQIVEFDFTFTANANKGSYRQYLQPILDGSTMWNMGALSWQDITVQ
jgi:hypothetical protein